MQLEKELQIVRAGAEPFTWIPRGNMALPWTAWLKMKKSRMHSGVG